MSRWETHQPWYVCLTSPAKLASRLPIHPMIVPTFDTEGNHGKHVLTCSTKVGKLRLPTGLGPSRSQLDLGKNAAGSPAALPKQSTRLSITKKFGAGPFGHDSWIGSADSRSRAVAGGPDSEPINLRTGSGRFINSKFRAGPTSRSSEP
jgi:hypothetical protein